MQLRLTSTERKRLRGDHLTHLGGKTYEHQNLNKAGYTARESRTVGKGRD